MARVKFEKSQEYEKFKALSEKLVPKKQPFLQFSERIIPR